ncbi:MAG TPA: cytochrome c oxidase subunit II [Gaiellaceae bacterium]|nr:cytochrome c oxidase subunit II [Gaiellaceae bacterium]
MPPAACLVLLLAGCGGNQNTLTPASSPARAITQLWWVMFVGAVIGFGSIVLLLFLGWSRRKRPGLPGGGSERRETGLVVLLGVVVPVIVLVALFVYADVFVMRSTAAPKPSSTAMTIHVIGHQWFWEVRYPGTRAVTANEIHIPVGVPVDLVGTTADVIHSFWVPELNRKVDLIPGRANRILLESDRAGRFRGQCSEFCGLQHAHMAVAVVAEPRAQFRAWLRNMARPAAPPRTAAARRGEQVFLAQTCSACHEIRGTAARGTIGPDLTHVASRQTLAALTIPNDRAALREWIADPQHVKPGVKMPAVPLGPGQLTPLVDYLESLR